MHVSRHAHRAVGRNDDRLHATIDVAPDGESPRTSPAPSVIRHRHHDRHRVVAGDEIAVGAHLERHAGRGEQRCLGARAHEIDRRVESRTRGSQSPCGSTGGAAIGDG